MKKFLGIILSIINWVTFIILTVVGVTGIIFEFSGQGTFIGLFEKLNIPWSYNFIWSFIFVNIILLIISYVLRKKFF